VTVPVRSLRPGPSPRLDGEDKAHIARLAEIEGPLPPVLVDRRSMRVIDGMHRLMAAMLTGQETISVQYYDGSEADAFLRAVEANVTHGLPLTLADRRAAAARIVRSHPHMSDRSISELVGLANKTVGTIRRSAGAAPQVHSRVGRDGKVRPLDGALGRERAAALMAEQPDASLREVARAAGVSPGTVRDVRRRLRSGLEPVPNGYGRAGDGAAGPVSPDLAGTGSTGTRPGGTGSTGPGPSGPSAMGLRGAGPGLAAGRRAEAQGRPPVPAAMLERLRRDPSLRYNEQGRRLLHVLQLNMAMAGEWASMMGTVPPHCATAVALLAQEYAQMWLCFADEVRTRPDLACHDGSRDASG
jgi:ParB-like chromosome segregation protein Spo0J